MRFVKVAVKNFQSLESAEVEFGPGLNVLFGPNDLGKSTFAAAIRAALLVPPSSSEADRYRPWFADAVPEVTLTFVDDDARFWRVRKTFGEASAQAAADLFHSKDGIKFDRECGGREVEDRLRQLLAWGIPSPGGKGAPRKLPTSFLAHVLLAEQVAVETILQQSMEEDGTSSGKDRLRRALAALAEDPRFKKVLDAVQEKVNDFFTPTGQRKRGRGSLFTAAAEDIKRLSERLDGLRKAVSDSQATQSRIRELQAQFSRAREVQVEATTALETLRKQWARSEERTKAERRLAEVRNVLDGLDRRARDIAERERGVEALRALVALADTQSAEARGAVKSAETVLRGAEEALRSASGEDGAREREVARAKLEKERAEVAAQANATQRRIEDLEAAEEAFRAAAAAAKAKTETREAEGRARAAEEAAERAVSEAERELELARAVLVCGQWQEAHEAGKLSREAESQAEAERAEVSRLERAADESEIEGNAKLEEAKGLSARLPDPALVRAMEELSQRIALAEAALGGGFSVTLRGSGKVLVHATADGQDSSSGTLVDGRVVIEANRSASLRVGELLDVEIIAGAAEKRRELERLREEWSRLAEPALERAGAASLAELRERLERADALESSAEKLRAQAREHRLAAQTSRQSAELLEQRSQELRERAREADALRAKLDGLDVRRLEAMIGELGEDWKSQAESLAVAKDKALAGARTKLEEARRERDQATFRAADSETKASEAAAEAKRRLATLGLVDGDTPDMADMSSRSPVTRALVEATADLSGATSRQKAIEDSLAALEEQASSAVSTARAAVERAANAREAALEEFDRRARALEEARSKFDTARGELAALRSALASEDRAAAEARFAEARDQLERYANDPVVSPERLTSAEQLEAGANAELARIRGELQHAEGALTKVGGLAVEEELKREEEALSLAKERQRELEIDADSWRLLRETLEAAEREGSTHLGRSLAVPVTARFSELTQSRYRAIRIDQHLKVETVDVSVMNVENALRELSVGTRDQLATLLRLTIAEQLKSAVVLDDHLVHTDPERLAWFKGALRSAALNTQVLVISCRPEDYLAPTEIPNEVPIRDLAGGAVRALDFARLSKRFAAAAPGGPPGPRDTVSIR